MIASQVTVNDGTTLTLDPSTILKGEGLGLMKVLGRLDANGAAGNEVAFTSLKDDTFGGDTNGDGSATTPAVGDWDGIWLEGSGVNDGIGELDFCHIRYGGDPGGSAGANLYFGESNSGNFTDSTSGFSAQNGVWVFRCSPTINRSTFADNATHGLFASDSLSAAPIITDNTFMDNGEFGGKLENITLTSYSGNAGGGNGTNGLGVNGTVSLPRTWSVGSSNFPFVIASTVTVNDGTTLTLNAGTIIKGDTTGLMKVLGKLDANGATGNQVVFTSLKDDTLGGDTNGDGGATTPAVGDWDGIWLEGSGVNDGIGEFDFCLIRYGGNPGGLTTANLYFDESNSGYFNDSISEFSGNYGVWILRCSPTINNGTFVGNTTHGLFASDALSAAPIITNNTFTNNTGFGAKLENITLTAYSGNTGSGNGTNGLGVNGTVTLNRTWSVGSGGFPFVIASTVTVNDGTTLTLDPGTIIKGDTTGLIKALGKLDVNGTAGTPVVFTSLKDDTLGGDTNNDADATVPAGGRLGRDLAGRFRGQ